MTGEVPRYRQCAELANAGYSYSQIATSIGIRKGTVGEYIRYARDSGIPVQRKQKVSHAAHVAGLYKSGLTVGQIAMQTGRTKKQVRRSVDYAVKCGLLERSAMPGRPTVPMGEMVDLRRALAPEVVEWLRGITVAKTSVAHTIAAIVKDAYADEVGQ